MCIYTHMLVYTYKCIYTRLHVYLSTVYIFYKLTCSLYIKKREIIFQEDYICFPHGKPKLVHFFFNISSDKFSFHLFCRITLPLHFCEVIEVCPSAVDGIIPLSWVHRILEDTSSIALESPKLGPVFQMWPQQYWRGSKDQFLQPPGNTLNASLEAVGLSRGLSSTASFHFTFSASLLRVH